MKQILNHLFEHKTFDKQEAKEILINIASGKYSHSQMAAFMDVYCMRRITLEELEGFRDAMLELCFKIDLNGHELIDLVGTGGDGKNTFNISTLASFVVAGAGYRVAKHGNYGVSSACGSSNVMEYLGYSFNNEVDKLRRCIDYAGICFLHAPLFHPAMKTVAPIRKELGVKTFFNILGPIVNPLQPKYQLIGVFSLDLARLYAYLYQQQSCKQYTIVHALDGYDEVSLTSDFKTFSNRGEHLQLVADLGFNQIDGEAIYGGNTVQESAAIFKSVLMGEGTTAQNQVVLSNAALAIQTIHLNKSFADCFAQAQDSLFGGKALSSFKKLLA
jgi:anthranilate phosphoribosyltransferase